MEFAPRYTDMIDFYHCGKMPYASYVYLTNFLMPRIAMSIPQTQT